MAQPRLTIICPVFNEETVITLFFERIRALREKLTAAFCVELVFCNNASTDRTLEEAEKIRSENPWVFILNLSRNVGYQASIECGLRNAKGDLFVVIDVDCEDPPEMICDFIAKMEEGYDVVYGERVDRSEPMWIKSLRKIFYRLMRWVGDENIILDMAEFSLITGEVRNAIIQDGTSFPFIRASIGRVGFRVVGIPYKRHPRVAGASHFNMPGMIIFAVAGILSSSTLFLRVPIYILPIWTVFLVGLGIFMTLTPTTWALPAFLIITAIYLGATLAFIAIYIARIYKNTLGRPNFILREKSTYFQS